MVSALLLSIIDQTVVAAATVIVVVCHEMSWTI
jgi:hypothetical protein